MESTQMGGQSQEFKSALSNAYNEGRGFEDIPLIKAFLQASKGFEDGKPIHYPRATPNGRPAPPSPTGEYYKWFVANEKKENRYVLRNLWRDEGLPTLQESQAGRRKNRRQRRRP